VHSREHETATLDLDSRRMRVGYYSERPGTLHLAIDGKTITLRNDLAYAGLPEEKGSGGRVIAPMHGVLLEVFVKPGESVSKGSRLAVLEAMKMQHELLSEVDGVVQEVPLAAGAQVAADDLLFEISVSNGG
jgi:geranyl-CoA carboxylase alpha subunit